MRVKWYSLNPARIVLDDYANEPMMIIRLRRALPLTDSRVLKIVIEGRSYNLNDFVEPSKRLTHTAKNDM